MSEILLELLSEEIPARMQEKAAQDLQRLVTDQCVELGLTYADATYFVTPRRLTLVMAGVAEQTLPKQEERKGPRVNAPEKAIAGFVKSTGIAQADLQVRSDKKGDFYVAVLTTPARSVEDVLAEVIPNVIHTFPWPKSMRWGSGSLRWVRPLHSILCVKTDAEGMSTVVPFDVDGITSGNTTQGHRVHSQGEITVSSGGYESYVRALEDAYVILNQQDRQEKIRGQAETLAFAQGAEVVPDDALVREMAGLVEWPVVLLGDIPEAFLNLPPEVLQTSMRTHQKFLSVKHAQTERIEMFITAANIQAPDGGAKILAGNQRVLKARLADAQFFWNNDLQTSLEDMQAPLKKVTFHNKLGSQHARVKRIVENAVQIAQMLGADVVQCQRAAEICKADLSSQMVFEFPELQGIMGRYYAQHAGETDAVAQACADHYKPLGPSDTTPHDLISVTVALADKIDQLAGFWSIDETPTGSKDPFALRRAALGVIRLILENNINCDVRKLLAFAFTLYPGAPQGAPDRLLQFILERFKVYLRDKGTRYDLIDACLVQEAVNLGLLVKRIEALQAMCQADHGPEVMSAAKRVLNILKSEEAKDGVEYTLEADSKFFKHNEEHTLLQTIQVVQENIVSARQVHDFKKMTQALRQLKEPLSQFFEHVVVNSENSVIRRNRLCLLNMARRTLQQVADLDRVVD